MIEKTLKTTTGKLRLKIPSVLNEVTLGHLILMQQDSNLDDLKAISILSDIPLVELQNISNIDDLGTFGDCVSSLADQIKNLYNCDVIPKQISFPFSERSISIKVPDNLSIEPAGAFMAARDVIAGEIKTHIEKYGSDNFEELFNPSLKTCCLVLANYFFCRVTGKKYNEYEAEEFCNIIKKLRVTEALPIAKHFFSCCPSLSKPKINFFRRLQLLWRKKPGFSHSKNSNI